MKGSLAIFLAGLIFALGLGISGMTRPGKVVAFLDITGRWDPSLAFVMLGAIGVHSLAYRILPRMPSPLLAERFAVPTRQDISVRLIGGAVLFGVGWGLGGFCPGPALVSLVSGAGEAALFVGGMLGGMAAFNAIDSVISSRQPASSRRAS